MKSPLQLIKAMESASSGKSEEAAKIDQINRDKAKRLGLDSEVAEAPKAVIPGSVKIVASSSATDAESDVDTSSDSDSSSEGEPASDVQESESVTASQVLEIANALKTQVEQQAEAHKAEVERLKAEYEARLAEQQEKTAEKAKEVEAERTLADVMRDLNKLMGKPAGATEEKKPLTVEGSGSQEMRNYERLLETAPKSIVNSPQLGRIIQADPREAEKYFRKNREAIRCGVEAVMKEAGFLTGNISTVTTESLTLNQIPSVSFQYLSSVIRNNALEEFVWHQFVDVHPVPGVAPRMTASVPRYPYNARPTSYLDRILTPGTALSNTTRNTTEDLVQVVIQECGLGKDDANAPLGVSEFVEAMSLVDLEGIIERNLGVDYQGFKDLWIATVFFTANTVLYNNNGQVTDAASDITTGSDATLTRDFLINLYAWMRSRKIPTYQDGCYALVTHPYGAAQLVAQMKDNERYYGVDMTQSVSNMLSRSTQNEGLGGELSGFVGKIDNFWIFQQNARSTGIEAGDPGVSDVAFDAAVGTKTTYTSHVFGQNAVCWATALPTEIRQDSSGTFGRLNRLVWISHEACAAKDVVEVPGVSERRVVEIRTLLETV